MPIEEENLRLGVDTLGMSVLFKRRDALNDLLMDEHIAEFIGESVDRLVPELVRPYSRRLGVQVSVVEQSLFGLLGHKSGGYPTVKDCRKANTILASNVDQMKTGHPLEPFIRVHRREWAPMALVDGYPDVSFRGKKGYTGTFLSMAGYTATEEFKRFMPSKGMFKHIHRGMFSLPRFRYEGLKLLESYIGMWTWVLLDPALKWDVFSRAECSPTFELHNRALLNGRTQKCMYGYDARCVACPVGMENCERATHRGMFVQKLCHRCQEVSLFKQDEPEEIKCIHCKNREFSVRKRLAMRGKRRADGDESEAGRQEPVV